MLTLDDIAERVGVSPSTVSRALAGNPLVNATTRERIVLAAQQAGYQVNSVARSLATRTTHSVGLIVPEVTNPYYPELIQRVVDRARAAGYTLLLNLSGGEQQNEAECLNLLRERRADGVLLVAGSRGLVAPGEMQALRLLGVPVVAIGWIDEPGDIDVVAGDDISGGRQLTEHLIALGHRRIVCVAGDVYPARASTDRILGMEQALRAAGLPWENSVRSGFISDSDADFRRQVETLLAEADRPTALFAYNDILALKLLSTLADMGVSVPAEISVVGYDNLDLTNLVSPRLTTVDYPIRSFAEEAVTLLLSRIEAQAAIRAGRAPITVSEPRNLVLTPRLVVRQSSGPPPSS
jgi:LacI family transcriptional regulator